MFNLLLRTGAPMEQFSVPQQEIQPDQSFDFLVNLPWIIPSILAFLTLVWRIFVWFSRRKKN